MPVTKTLMAVGSWSLTLSPDTPRALIDALSYFGHVVVATGRQDPRVAGDSLFTSGRYTGTITGLDFQSLKQGRGPVVSGDGLETWLGTPNGVGPVIEAPLSFTSAAPSTVFNGLRPSSVGAGTNFSLATSATYTGAFVWKTPRDALTSFCTQVSTGMLPSQTVEWRVNNNCTMDTGPVSSLYVTTPITAIVAKNEGVDMSLRGLAGVAELIEDVKDYTDRVVVLASGSGASTAVGAANAADVGASVPYKDFFGNTVQMTRMVSASSVSAFNATAAAQSALIPYTTPRDQVKLSSSEYDIMGELNVGDYTYVYDPDSGLVDPTNEVVFRGQRINPAKLRVIELTWPIVYGMTVAYKSPAGTWYDLTDYIQWETGDTSVVVGGFNRSLVPTSEPVGPRPQPDTTVPGVPVFNTPFSTSTYRSSSEGSVKAQIQLSWATPSNTDGTTMTDLDHYEIRYRPDLTYSSVNPTWQGLHNGGFSWAQLNSSAAKWNQIFPVGTTDWKVTFVAGGTNILLIQELTPGVTYDFQIRAADAAQPPNRGAWSATTTFQAGADTEPPPVPDAPTVAANLLSVQISWDCGRADGGTFNQAPDMHHIEVHGSYDPLFVPAASTKLGNLPASVANINGLIPVVGSFTIPPGQPPAQQMYIKVIAVDSTGNKSGPSAAAGSSANLISDIYVTDLSVSKLTAGTITASIVLAGTIATGPSGQRVVMDANGLHSYNPDGSLFFDLNDNSSTLLLAGAAGGPKITLDTIGVYPTIRLYDTADNNNSFWNVSNSDGNTAALGINSGNYTGSGNTYRNRLFMQGVGNGAMLAVIDDSNQATNGGLVQVTTTVGLVGVFVEGATHGGQLRFAYDGTHSDATWELDGYYNGTGAVPSPQFGIFVQNFSGLGSGSGGANVGYGTTLFSGATPMPIYSCGTLGQTGGNVNATSTSGYSFTLSGGSPASWSIFSTIWRSR